MCTSHRLSEDLGHEGDNNKNQYIILFFVYWWHEKVMFMIKSHNVEKVVFVEKKKKGTLEIK